MTKKLNQYITIEKDGNYEWKKVNGGSSSSGGGTTPDLSNYYTKTQTDAKLQEKENVIEDLSVIRTGAEKGATAVLPTDLQPYALKSELPDVSRKQDTLVSGTNIKTINNQSILGSGNIEIGGGGTFTQELADWNQTDQTAVDFIKNKPFIPDAFNGYFLRIGVDGDLELVDSTDPNHIISEVAYPAVVWVNISLEAEEYTTDVTVSQMVEMAERGYLVFARDTKNNDYYLGGISQTHEEEGMTVDTTTVDFYRIEGNTLHRFVIVETTTQDEFGGDPIIETTYSFIDTPISAASTPEVFVVTFTETIVEQEEDGEIIFETEITADKTISQIVTAQNNGLLVIGQYIPAQVGTEGYQTYLLNYCNLESQEGEVAEFSRIYENKIYYINYVKQTIPSQEGGEVVTTIINVRSILLATLNSPNFTGIPTAPTAASGTNTTLLATTEFVQLEIANIPSSGGETNVIEGITLNGTPLQPNANKVVAITDIATQTALTALIERVTTLESKVATLEAAQVNYTFNSSDNSLEINSESNGNS